MEKSWLGPGAPSPLSQIYRASTWKKHEPGYDELPLSTEWNISVRMLCVVRLGPARRVDSLETVYMRTSWLTPQAHPVSLTKWPYPQSHPTPRARFAVSHVNGQRWFISNCRETWLAPLGSGWRVPRVPGPTFLHINRAVSLLLAVKCLLILQVYGRQVVAILILISANYFNVPFCKTRNFLSL